MSFSCVLYVLYLYVDVIDKLACGVVDSFHPQVIESQKLLTDVTYVFD